MPLSPDFSHFVSDMAHDLRSPLTSLKGFSATLVANWDRFDDAQRRELVTLIHSDADRMKDLIADVVDLARLASGRLELRRSRVEAGDLAAAAVGNLQEGAQGFRLAVEFGSASVWGDLERLATAVRHLVENALHYSDGQVWVHIYGSAAGLTIEVTDEGAGIDDAKFEEAVAGKRQSDTGSRPAYGLRLASALIGMHGGRLEHRRGLRRGTTFVVEVPDTELVR